MAGAFSGVGYSQPLYCTLSAAFFVAGWDTASSKPYSYTVDGGSSGSGVLSGTWDAGLGVYLFQTTINVTLSPGIYDRAVTITVSGWGSSGTTLHIAAPVIEAAWAVLSTKTPSL